MDTRFSSRLGTRWRRRAGALHRLLLVAFAVAAAPAQQATPLAPTSDAHTAAAAMRRACEEFLAAEGIVGMGVAVLDDGNVVLDAAFGFADRDAQRAAETTTLFRLGSISKPVAATIALQMVDEKMLDLDADVREHLKVPASHLPAMTLRQLLSHTAGIRHYRPDRRDNSTTLRTTAQSLDLFLGDPLVAPPGTRHSYSTHGYTLVAAVLEAKSDKCFVDLVRERVRGRGAPSLDCEVLADDKPQRSSLYDRGNDGRAVPCAEREDNSWKYAGGGMESTALDLARFADGVRTDKLVSRAGREAMWTNAKLADGKEVAYGLGWRVASNRSAVAHTGAQQGAQSALMVLPGAGVVIAVLTNTSRTRPQELVGRLQALLVKQEAGK